MHRFSEFAKSRQYPKNVTRKTLDWYECSFGAFARFHPEPDYTKESLRAFVIRLRDSGVSAISANTYCRAINAYLRWVHEEGFTDSVLRIPPLKTEKKIVATFSPTDVRKLLGFRPRLKSEDKLYTLTALLLDTGLRIEEALTLTRDSVDLDNMLLRVVAKGRSRGSFRSRLRCGSCSIGGCSSRNSRSCSRPETAHVWGNGICYAISSGWRSVSGLRAFG